MEDDNSDAEALLDSIGLISFLENDARPTLVLDTTGVARRETARLVYKNPAFKRFRLNAGHVDPTQHDTDLEPLLRWATSAPSPQTFAFSEGTWTAFSVQKRWKVVVGKDGDTTSRPLLSARLPAHSEPRGAKRPKASGLDERSQHSSAPRLEHRERTPSKSETPSHPSHNTIDWTRTDLPGLSPYIQAFRKFDWSTTSLGPMETWSHQLRLIIVTVMSNPAPRLLLWGPEYTMIYNEACIPIFGRRHPASLGRSPWDAWSDVWGPMKPLVEAAMEEGKTAQVHQMPLSMERSPGLYEETFFSFILQPILGQDGAPCGVLDQFTEVTNVVLAERRMRTVLRVGENAAGADSLDGVWKGVLTALDANVDDVAFAIVYSVVNDDNSSDRASLYSLETSTPESISTRRCALEGVVGFGSNLQSIETELSLSDEEKPFVKQFYNAWEQNRSERLDVADGTLPTDLAVVIPGRAGGVRCSQAVVCPIFTAGNCLGFLVLGLSPRRPYDEDYQLFVRLLTDRVNHTVAAVSLPKEQRMVQAAAEEAVLRHATISRQLMLRTQEAEQREARFARMASASPMGCFLLRVDGTPIYLNDAYYKITGFDKPEEVSFGADALWRKTVLPEDIPKVEKAWYDMVEDKKPTMVEYRLFREWRSYDKATGVDIHGPTWLLVTAFPDLDDDGEVQSITGWVSDISLRKWTEALQAKRLTEALESKLQSERFIDLVSHEMRNPLSAILQSADSILSSMKELEIEENKSSSGDSSPLRENGVDVAVEGAKTIMLCAQHQKRIVDDILTLSKLDSDLLVLCPEVVYPVDLAKKALKMYESELQSGGITADIIVDDSYEQLGIDAVFLDPSRLLQVLINLLTNAIKFTRGRSRRQIKVSLSASTNPPSQELSIPYMPRRGSRPAPELSPEWGDGPEIYLMFAIEDSGTGLSQDELNSLFKRFAQATPKTHVQYGGSGLGLFISKELSELQGGQIGGSSQYGEGSTFAFYIRAKRYIPELQQRKLSLRREDIHQSLPSPDNPTPVSRPETIEMNGIDAEVPQLFAPTPTIGQPQLLSSPGRPSSPPTPTSRKAKDLHVLIVEDNIINQKVMSAGLKRLGCTVHVANHGLEAIEFLEKSTFKTRTNGKNSNWTPTPLSLILLDVEMPVMDGLTCVRRIREMERDGQLQGHVPVAAVTANARTEQLNHALSHGMDLVVTKPFRIPELVPKMLALVEGTHIPNKNPIFTYIETRS